MFSSLRIKDFRFFWGGLTCSLVGTWVQMTAQSWLVFELTRSAFLLGLVSFLSYLPLMLFSFPAGIFADRHVKRNLLITTQVLFMGLAFSLAFLVFSGAVTVRHIILIALLNGSVMALDAPVRQSMVAELVGRRHLLNAVALNSASFNSARLIGPALAGLLIATVGMAGCFFVNAISFLPIIILLPFIRPVPPALSASQDGFLQQAKDAVVFIRSKTLIFGLLILVGTVSLFGVSYIILMPVFADDVFHAGVRGLALLMSANGLGALLGALRLARLRSHELDLAAFKVSLLVFFISLSLFALSSSLGFSLVLLIITGYFGVRSISMVNTLLQMNIPDVYRGRVMGWFIMMFAGIMPFGHLLAGLFSQRFGVQIVVFCGALLAFLVFFFVDRKVLRCADLEVACA